MKRYSAFILAAAVIASAGCKPQHPSVIKVEPDFKPGDIQTILVLPVISLVTEGEDPLRESERITNRVLWEYISELGEYTFQSPETYRMKVYAARLSESIKDYNDKWASDHVVDENLLQVLSSLNVDMILIPLVYLWAKDEADYRETGSASATQVGMTISLVDPSTGRIMWEATDENYRESVRTEGDRVQATSGGINRRISGTSFSGKDIYAAPPFEDVVVMVVSALVDAIPEKLAPSK
ncbi:MAG: hypothetical protein JW746_04400 [Candidatus Krumholzibacteriota bacterium]|nr:hypothetical protein [Candidatus Krumholzibacteriota bacterium]